MSLENKALKRKLSKYPKDDIIDAVCAEFNADYIVGGMLIFLEGRRVERLLDEESKAFKAQNEAGDAYVAWHSDMIKRYGDGKEVNLADIPTKELDKGIKLGKVWEEARNKSEGAMKRLHLALGIPCKKEAAHENA